MSNTHHFWSLMTVLEAQKKKKLLTRKHLFIISLIVYLIQFLHLQKAFRSYHGDQFSQAHYLDVNKSYNGSKTPVRAQCKEKWTYIRMNMSTLTYIYESGKANKMGPNFSQKDDFSYYMLDILSVILYCKGYYKSFLLYLNNNVNTLQPSICYKFFLFKF